MKKTQLLFIFLLLSLVVAACTKQLEEKPAERAQPATDSVSAITGGISEVDKVNSDVSVTDVDSDLANVDAELKDW